MITKTGEQGLQMAELTINADDVRIALNEFAASYEPGNAERVEVGRVTTAGDGIARVEGLPSVMANELLRCEDGTLGLAHAADPQPAADRATGLLYNDSGLATMLGKLRSSIADGASRPSSSSHVCECHSRN